MPKLTFRIGQPQEVRNRIIYAAHRLGRSIFDESQIYVPVKTGALKRSGVLRTLPNGFVIQYTVHYASKQEFGVPPGFTEEVGKHTVRKHTRKGIVKARRGTINIPRHAYYNKEGKRITVKRHRRSIDVPAGMRLETVKKHERGPFTRRYPRGLEGKFYLTRAYEAHREELQTEIYDALKGV